MATQLLKPLQSNPAHGSVEVGVDTVLIVKLSVEILADGVVKVPVSADET